MEIGNIEKMDIRAMERGRIRVLTRLLDAGSTRIFDCWMEQFIPSLQMSRSDEIIAALAEINARAAQAKEIEKQYGRGSALNLDHPFAQAAIHAYMQRGSRAISGEEISAAILHKCTRSRFS
ncbi:hypothetical protein V5F38_19445 [Xanthobacter sp. V0B-10]|uniref:hypothetical protein n=1 Tax=Xanthobacter albus TaxID=3119929 RepID=UPI00372B3829